MANTLLTPTMIVREAARRFMNNLVVAKHINRQFDKAWKFAGLKAGQSINLRMNPRYVGVSGAALGVEDHTEWQRPLTVYPQYHVDVSFTSFEMTFSLQDFGERVIKNAMVTLANKVDADCLTMMKNNTANATGMPGTAPSSMLTVAQAGAFMAQDAAPQDDDKTLILEPMAMATYFDAFKGLFQQSEAIGEQYRSGMVSRAAGMKWFQDQNVAVHTVGPMGGTPLVLGTGQGVLAGAPLFTDLATDGWTASGVRLNTGDIITIGTLSSGIVATNPVNHTTLNRLRQFVVGRTDDTVGTISSDAGGLATLRLRPAIIAGGPFQNCVARTVDNQSINIFGAANVVTPQNIVYHKDAFTMAMFELEVPGGTDQAAMLSDPETGIAIRYARQWQIATDAWVARFDIAYALGPYNPEWACRIAG